MLDRTLDDFDDAGGAAAHLIRFELAMLAELGFGLDLENCAATGETADLIYVSPKSGGAVSRRAGEPYRDRLLRLPAFLREGEGGANGWSDQDLQDGFRADRAVPAPPRAGAARAGPFRREGRVYQRGDAEPGANQFVGLTRSLSPSSLRTQGPIRRGPSIGAVAPAIFRHKHLWLWVPACAGTTDVAHSRLARFSRKV